MYTGISLGGGLLFTSIRIINFKSFGDITFDFHKKKNEAKNLVLVYGENGSGKTNLVEAFDLIPRLLDSFDISRNFERIMSKIGDGKENPVKFDLLKLVYGHFGQTLKNELRKYLGETRMIDCTEPTTVEYCFVIDGIEGKYIVSYKNQIVFEELYYLINKQRGKLFTISGEENISIDFNKSLFQNQKFKEECEGDLKQFWGKHSFLGLLVEKLKSQNQSYIFESISNNLIGVILSLRETYVNIKGENDRALQDPEMFFYHSSINFPDFTKGMLEKSLDSEKLLNTSEKIIKELLLQLYTDIKDVYYSRSDDENNINYELYVKKFINGKLRNIRFDLESSGTQKIAMILNSLIAAMNGATVIFDEMDCGIHDLLMKNIFASIQENIKGQLIITTHNTILLEAIDPKAEYIIDVDANGNKKAKCIADFANNVRIRDTNNARKQYLSGVFGGIPYSSNVDYSYVLDIIKNYGKDDGKKEEGQ